MVALAYKDVGTQREQDAGVCRHYILLSSHARRKIAANGIDLFRAYRSVLTTK